MQFTTVTTNRPVQVHQVDFLHNVFDSLLEPCGCANDICANGAKRNSRMNKTDECSAQLLDDFLAPNNTPCAAICPNSHRSSARLCATTSNCADHSSAANYSNYSTASICTASICFLQSRPNCLQPRDAATRCPAIPSSWWPIAAPDSATATATITAADADATTATQRESSTPTPAIASIPAPATVPADAELDGWPPDDANDDDDDAGQSHSTAHELDDDH